MRESMHCVPLIHSDHDISFLNIQLIIPLCVKIESSFVCGHSYAVVELELAFDTSNASLRIFGNSMSYLESLSSQLILA